MTYEEYDALPGIRAGDLKQIVRSPAHYRWHRDNPQSNTPALAFGRVFHLAILEPRLYATQTVIAPDCDRRTTAGKQIWAEFQNASAGKIVASADDHIRLMNMHAAVMSHPSAREMLIRSTPEITKSWNDQETGAPCKARADMLSHSRDWLADVKTTTDASPRSVRNQILKYGYHIQAAHYCDGFVCDDFRFIFVEKTAPYMVACYCLDADSLDAGRRIRMDAIRLLQACDDSDTWPGYSPEIETVRLPEFIFEDEEDE